MPIPKPHKDEDKDKFMDRCMSDDVMIKEYPKNKQRYVICQQAWDEEHKSKRQKYKVWGKQDAISWLKEHDFKTGNYEKLANYHSFRQEDPDKYDEFRLKKAPFGFKESDGVVAVYGIYQKEGKRTSEIQAIRFYHGEADKEKESNIMNDIEMRSFRAEFRKDGDDKPKIKGQAAVFDQLSDDLGGFKEIIHKGSFGELINTNDVFALINHNENLVLGRNRSGTLKLNEDDEGLDFVIDPPNTSYANDLLVSMERKDIDKCSFAFVVDMENVKWKKENGIDIRHIYKFKELWDISIVTYPGFPQTKAQIFGKNIKTPGQVYREYRSKLSILESEPMQEQMAMARNRLQIYEKMIGGNNVKGKN